MILRPAVESDWPAIWAIFRDVVAAGDVFAYDESTTVESARELWFDPPVQPFVAESNGVIVGTYFIRPNQPGRGNHIANGGYMVSPDHRGRGIASAMCEHSLKSATEAGYRGLQFNFVVSSNAAALQVWQKHGFRIVGTIPEAFRHRTLGFVDANIMFRTIE